MLGPDEQFTVMSLSGDKPKRANVIKAVCLLLGPDFFTDIITIETADHARLQLQLSYNWYLNRPRDQLKTTASGGTPENFNAQRKIPLIGRLRRGGRVSNTAVTSG